MKAPTLSPSRLRSIAALACAALAVSLVAPARAADGTWLGISGTWSNTTIWSGGIVADGIDSKANFIGVNIGATRLITNDVPRTLGTINFTDATTGSHNLAISGSSLTLDVSTGFPLINVTNQILTLSNQVAGTKGFAKNGGGTLILTANNTGLVGSNVTVNAGSLRLSVSSGALGGASGPTILLGNSAVGSTATAIFEAGNSINLANGIVVQSGPTTPGLRTISSAAAISPTFSGAIAANESVRILQDNAGGTINISGAGSTIAPSKTVSFLANDTGSMADNAPWSGDGTITYSTTGSTAGGGLISIGGQKTHTGGSQILSMAGNTNTPSTAAVTASSIGPAGSPTSGPFGTGILTLGAGRLRATTNADITIANVITLGGNTIFPSVANEKSLLFTGPVTLTTNRTVTVDVGTTVPGEFVEFQGVIGQSAGPFSFTKAGTGVLVLGSSNTYSGNTGVSGGTLQLGAGASLNSSPVITLGTNTVLDVTSKGGTFEVLAGQTLTANGATVTGGLNVSGALTLTGGGQADATTTVSNGATLNLNGPGSVTNLTFVNTATLNFNFGTGGLLTVTGTDGVTNNGAANSITINLIDVVSPVPGTYTLIAYSGSLQGTGFSAYQLGAAPPGATYALLDTPGAVQLVVTPLLTWTGLESSEWSINTLGGLKNWQLLGTPTDYADGQDVTLDDSATGTTTVDISVADVTPTRVIVNSSLLTYTLQGSQGIAGSAALFKRGTNNLVIANDNTYNGATTITAGRLTLGNGGTTGSISNTAAITNNAALFVNRSDALTIPSVISGIGSVTMQGPGTLTITGTNTYNGATLVSAGTLQLGASDLIPNGAGKTGVTVNGTFDLNGFSETINGLGGAGVVDNTGINPVTLTVGGNNASSTFSGIISNSGGTLNLTKIGSGTTTLSGTNTFTGLVDITAGTLALGSFNTVDGVSSITIAGGATLRPNFSNIVLNVPISLGSNGTTATITAPGPGDAGDLVTVTLNGVISGSGNVLLDGVNGVNSFGTIILNAQNTYGGSTTLDSAGNNANCFVRLGTNNALPVTTVLILEGGVGTGSGRSVELNLNGFDQTVAGLTNILSTPRRQQRVINNSATPATLNVNNTADYTYLGQLGNSAPNGNFTLVKSGSGTLTLQPATTQTNGTTILNNFYTGGTVINAGTLLVNNTSGSGTGSGAVTVNGGTFGGTGTIAGAVTVNAGGTLSPGTAIGTLTINNDLVLAGTTVLDVNKTAGTRDQVLGVVNATYGGALVVNNLAGTLAAGDSFAIFTATTPSGNFTSITPAPGAGLLWEFNPATGVLSVVNASNVQLLSFTQNSAGDLTATGTGGVPFANYVVVTATNMAIPLVSWEPIQTNAFDAGGNFNITISNAVTAPVRAQFYRMVEP